MLQARSTTPTAPGLELRAWVLDLAEPETSWDLVERISRLANLPQLCTVDGLAEARNLVAQRREKRGQGRPRSVLGCARTDDRP